MHKKTERSAICRIHESQKAAEEIYRGSALEEAMIELVAIKGEGWLEVFRDKLVSRMRDHVVGGDKAFDGVPVSSSSPEASKR